MDTSSIVNAVSSIAVAYLAVLNTNTLVMAVVAFVIGTTIVGIILKKTGVTNGSNSLGIVDWLAFGGILFIFYRKYGLIGGVVSVVLSAVLQILLSTVLNMF